VLPDTLFCSPWRDHYYFGDYYDASCVRLGFYPWYEVASRHAWYDPVYAHRQWRHRDDPKWTDGMRRAYELRRDHKEVRPARTYGELRKQLARMPESDRKNMALASTLKDVIAGRPLPPRYQPVDDRQKVEVTKRNKDMRDFGQQRAQWERTPGKPPIDEPVTKGNGVDVGRRGDDRNDASKQDKTDMTRSVDDHGTPARLDKGDKADKGGVQTQTMTRGEPRVPETDIQPRKVKMATSPITRRNEGPDVKDAPPARPEPPKVNENVKPSSDRNFLPATSRGGNDAQSSSGRGSASDSARDDKSSGSDKGSRDRR
jgi:hypothetical protein